MTPQERVEQLAADVYVDRMWAAHHNNWTRDQQKSFLEGYWKPAVDRHPEIAPLKTNFLLSLSLPIPQREVQR